MKLFSADVNAYGGEIYIIRASDLEAATRIARELAGGFECKIKELPADGPEGLIETFYR